MRGRRRRWLRDDTLAPWLTAAVILGCWWGASWLVATPAPDATVVVDAAPPPDPSAGASARELDVAGERTAPAESPLDEPPTSPDDRGAKGDAAPAALLAPVPVAGHVVPVAGVDAGGLTSTFADARGGGARRHEAMDIMAPRGTPVVASVSGRIVKLFTSAAGGLTIYQFDEEERYCYYYAHLEAYAPDLTEGQAVQQGQIIGFVGSTGNAAPDAPHLHFAISRLGPEKRWWEGEPLDPITFLQ